MNKIVYLIITVLSISLLTSCSSAPESNSETGEKATIGNVVKDVADKITDGVNAVKESFDEISLPAFDATPTIDETVIYDENDLKITATELKYSDYSAELKLIIENNRDEQYSVSGSCAAINEYMMESCYMRADIEPGKKSIESIKFSIEELQLYGIDTISDIQLVFEIADTEYNEYLTNPCTINTTAHDDYDYSINRYRTIMNGKFYEKSLNGTIDCFEEKNLYSDKEISVLSAAMVTNKDGETKAIIEIENSSSEYVRAAVRDPSINGLRISSGTWDYSPIIPNAKRVLFIDIPYMFDMFGKDCLKSFGIDKCCELSFEFNTVDYDNDDYTERRPIKITSSEKYKLDTSGEVVHSDDTFEIISKGLFYDPTDIFDEPSWILMVKNKTDRQIYVHDEYDSVSINGFMTDCWCRDQQISSGEYAVVALDFYDHHLEDAGITTFEEIENIEITLNAKNEDYNNLSSATIKFVK